MRISDTQRAWKPKTKDWVQRCCLYCKKEFWCVPSLIKQGKVKFCSKEHFDSFQKEFGKYGEASPSWKGGRHSSRGYIVVNTGNKKRHHEHTLIAMKILGRPLKWRKEVVHHINGNKKDNRNCNLLICTNSYHCWLENKMSTLYKKEHFGGELL